MNHEIWWNYHKRLNAFEPGADTKGVPAKSDKKQEVFELLGFFPTH